MKPQPFYKRFGIGGDGETGMRELLRLVFAAAAVLFMTEPALAQIQGVSGCYSSSCNQVCVSNSQFDSTDIGSYMIGQIFAVINQILQNLENTFFNGIINNPTFQQAIGIAFVLYIAIYGIMITFSLASYRSGEIGSRIIKVAIVYCMTAPTAWTFFYNWIQTPVIGAINQLIINMSYAGSGSGGGSCGMSSGLFSGNAITTNSSGSVQLDTGPMGILYGPMTCVFASKFMAGIEAMFSTKHWGPIFGLTLVWGLMEFMFMILGAIATYVKAIVGLTFLFALAPLFFAFYLFERSRHITVGWFSMVLGFALQPVMLFAFLAFYATILGNSLGNIFVDSSGNQEDICYVPWLNMPGSFTLWWWRFTNSSGQAGGEWINGASNGGTQVGGERPPPVAIMNMLYFVVLSHLGKNFTNYINELSTLITGGKGAGVVTGDQLGGWFRNNLFGGKGPAQVMGDTLTNVGNSLKNTSEKIGNIGKVIRVPPV